MQQCNYFFYLDPPMTLTSLVVPFYIYTVVLKKLQGILIAVYVNISYICIFVILFF